ncbi:MAG: helix-turn-helix domain-containing protein [Aureispira sp.]
MSLEEKIEHFISLNKESTNWDFKSIPHENNACLLHDIISMANCDCEDDRYIILGVSDPDSASGCEVVGLTKGQTNRKTQANLIDFLREKKNAGGIRPEVELRTINLQNKEIDVIVVLNKPNKPYYLTADYRDKNKVVRANYIYTRILDTNTPINQSADLMRIEKMWKERFGLTLPPLERMKLLLKQPENWFKNLGNKSYTYHKQFPEFRIEFSEPEPKAEVYSFFYTNSKSFLGNAVLKYGSTILAELGYLFVDEMRLEIGKPESKRLDKLENWYYYFDLSSLEGIFHYFLTNSNVEAKSRLEECQFLFFKNKEEQEGFNNFLIENEEEFLQIKPDSIAIKAKEEMQKQDFKPSVDPIFINKSRKMYEKWTKEKEIDKK